MSKPKMQGMNNRYIPNSRADAYRRPKLHDRHLQVVDPDKIAERREQKELRELERMKYGWAKV